MIHRIAFSNRAVQLTAADLEKALFGRAFRYLPIERPVFISSLPRAGTTLLLEITCQLPEFASHCYRDMPFVLAPMLWDTLSRKFRRTAVSSERAHGDGVFVSYDSPEAFEEVAWRAFWPEKFRGRSIALWPSDEENEDFERFFREHIQKIIAVRSQGQVGVKRYVSKNNHNIARVPFLRRIFSDGLIVVPFRNPVDQAASLLRQHLRFSAMHGQDSFSRRYMKDIGHLEFGELHRPIHFAGMDDILDRSDPCSLDYWIGYWVAAFTHILSHNDDVVLVSYEALCRGKAAALRALAERLECEDPSALEAAAGRLRPPREHGATGDVLDESLLDGAQALHDRLLDLSIV